MTSIRLLGLALVVLAWLPLAGGAAPGGYGVETDLRAAGRPPVEARLIAAPPAPAPEFAEGRLTWFPIWLAGRLGGDAVAGGCTGSPGRSTAAGFLGLPPRPTVPRSAWQFDLRAAGSPRAPCRV